MIVYATFAYFRKMLHLNFWMWHVHASLQTSWSALMCCLFRSWSTRTPWIPAVPGPLACSVDGVVYQRSSTIGANAARGAALLARGAVIFWSTSESVNSDWSSWKLQENEKKRQFLKTCHHRSSHPCREKMRQNLDLPSCPAWCRRSSDIRVSFSLANSLWRHGSSKNAWKIEALQIQNHNDQIVMITFGWRLNSLGTQLNISQDVLF